MLCDEHRGRWARFMLISRPLLGLHASIVGAPADRLSPAEIRCHRSLMAAYGGWIEELLSETQECSFGGCAAWSACALRAYRADGASAFDFSGLDAVERAYDPSTGLDGSARRGGRA